ncbi:hypothetical protein CAPTEDRAFT_184542 [Capitella teleta]|uniref:RING-type domain-containing protein n=1 Tax=Capitella teleta TaxID=283909 RepID=R7TW48_CAPTE|nr:hypothetical protein CAPTEDRAFT_184542 [Capitella teleta]|eukprot:ELT97954.1 hypothetical protein CAPTEDRAFT_184542 [Capitella teleta]
MASGNPSSTVPPQDGVIEIDDSASQPDNLSRVMQGIWPQLEQRIALEAAAALRGRGSAHSHEGSMVQPQGGPEQPVVLDMGPDPPLQGQNPEAPPEANAGGTRTGVPNLRNLLKGLEGCPPFIFLLLAKVLFIHRLGFLILIGLFGTFYHANNSLKRLVAQRETRNWFDSLGGLAWIVALLSANIFFIFVFEDQKLYRSLYLVLPVVEGPLDFWNLMWITGIIDFVIMFGSILLKALIAMLPKQVLLTKKKGKYFMLIEHVSQFYRSTVPITPWLFFLYDDQNGGPWFSTVLILLYVLVKGNHLYYKFLELKGAVSRFKLDVTYGSVPSQEQLLSADNCCPICQDKFTDPVLLTCTHIFCEDCVSLWFDRERTCPMCRANIVDNPEWRDGSTSGKLQVY